MAKNGFPLKLLLVCLGLFFALAFLEILFRLVEPGDIREVIRPLFGQDISTCRKKDPILHHVLVPNCTGQVKTKEYNYIFTTNSLGLKEDEISFKKPEGVFRVLVVGDSYVEGWGVAQKDVFTEVAEGILEGSGYRVEIINAGVASYSPALELDYLRLKGINLQPDLVIMMVDLNDFHDEFVYGGWERHLKVRKELFPQTLGEVNIWPPEESSKLKKFLSFSKLATTFYDATKAFYDSKSKVFSLESIIWESALFSKARDWKDYDKAFGLLSQNIYLTRDFLKDKGVDFAITTTSRGSYHGTDEWNPGRTYWGFEEGKVYEAKPIEIIKKIADGEGIGYIDVFNALEEEDAGPLFYSIDMHWTAKGHRAVGAVVADYIRNYMESK